MTNDQKSDVELPPIFQRLHVVMDTHKISRHRDLEFLSEIVWVLGVEVNFKLVPREKGME